MDYSCVFEEHYESSLGTLGLRLLSSVQCAVTSAENGVFTTAEHEVVVKRMFPALDWLPAGMQVESAKAWLFYISKHKVGSEQLAFRIELQAADATVQCGGATGQNLIAIELENGIREMHIGTEDEDAMAGRASVSDDMPARFERPLLKYELEITTITAWGLATRIPALEVGEQFYFHYIVAENPCRPSADYPGQTDISTWFAVEQPKKKLEQSWRAQS